MRGSGAGAVTHSGYSASPFADGESDTNALLAAVQAARASSPRSPARSSVRARPLSARGAAAREAARVSGREGAGEDLAPLKLGTWKIQNTLALAPGSNANTLVTVFVFVFVTVTVIVFVTVTVFVNLIAALSGSAGPENPCQGTYSKVSVGGPEAKAVVAGAIGRGSAIVLDDMNQSKGSGARAHVPELHRHLVRVHLRHIYDYYAGMLDAQSVQRTDFIHFGSSPQTYDSDVVDARSRLSSLVFSPDTSLAVVFIKAFTQSAVSADGSVPDSAARELLVRNLSSTTELHMRPARKISLEQELFESAVRHDLQLPGEQLQCPAFRKKVWDGIAAHMSSSRWEHNIAYGSRAPPARSSPAPPPREACKLQHFLDEVAVLIDPEEQVRNAAVAALVSATPVLAAPVSAAPVSAAPVNKFFGGTDGLERDGSADEVSISPEKQKILL
ncbi:hypothetical protein T492DRAFT_841043 [Pavlovales sp. CCMP2436]|nr:hypothetical protein T492DRAFT_841043 [Pavlovales sp. CCMP2436]